MIVLLHPRTSKPKNRRFPLPILAMAAVLEGKEDYSIVDGNLDPQPERSLDRIMSQSPAELLAVSVMPGPQMRAAIPLCREFRRATINDLNGRPQYLVDNGVEPMRELI